jgi:single-stranded-DNA-specific exonuclease
MRTLSGNIIQILGNIESNLEDLLLSNRNIPKDEKEIFFHPSLADLHDPWSLPDMLPSVERILEAREKKERIIIFGDYDVDGVTATTILVRFLSNI